MEGTSATTENVYEEDDAEDVDFQFKQMLNNVGANNLYDE